MEEKAFKKIQEVNDSFEYIDYPFKLDLVDPHELKLLDKNARYMKNETFKILVDNIKNDGNLSSIPFCWQDKGVYTVLSGNHRVKAARNASLDYILIMYTDKDLDKQERIAIQLSHNSLAGQDDPVILKELWEEIEEIDYKYYAGLDDKILDEIEPVSLDSLNEPNLDFRNITFLMLPEENERLKELFTEAIELISADETHLTRLKEFDRLLNAMGETKDSFNIKNSATALMVILDIYEDNKKDLKEGWLDSEKNETKHSNKVPLSSILGEDSIKAEDALIIEKAVKLMISRGDIDKKESINAIIEWAKLYIEQY